MADGLGFEPASLDMVATACAARVQGTKWGQKRLYPLLHGCGDAFHEETKMQQDTVTGDRHHPGEVCYLCFHGGSKDMEGPL